MNVGYLGSGWLARAAATRLAAAGEIVVSGPIADALPDRVVRANSRSELAQRCNVLFIDLGTREAFADALFGSDGLALSLAKGTIVIDQSVCDPDETRAMAARLAERDVVLLDAPLHCELSTDIADVAAILCGGPKDAVDSVRPLLEAICPKVIHCGDTGSGHAMRIVTGAVAACNRLISYECAAIGLTNGVALKDLATVITQSSGYNSATARVLPLLAEGGRTADARLAAEAEALRLAARLARRVGAPMVVASTAGSLVESAAAGDDSSATLDALARIHASGAGIDFERPASD